MKLPFIIILFCFTSLFGYSSFSKKATIIPIYVQSNDEKLWCPVCGKNIKDNYKTSCISKLANGLDRQYSSLYCLVEDMQEYAVQKDSIKVIDFYTQKLLDAKKAFYVLKDADVVAFSTMINRGSSIKC